MEGVFICVSQGPSIKATFPPQQPGLSWLHWANVRNWGCWLTHMTQKWGAQGGESGQRVQGNWPVELQVTTYMGKKWYKPWSNWRTARRGSPTSSWKRLSLSLLEIACYGLEVLSRWSNASQSWASSGSMSGEPVGKGCSLPASQPRKPRVIGYSPEPKRFASGADQATGVFRIRKIRYFSCLPFLILEGCCLPPWWML